ncbi:MAG: Mitochondrial intermediate peptidase [Thelocarpon impressellum]|nr:MAG: Mitochondrial intermediate peptidase [Thelocarpon impressellum]
MFRSLTPRHWTCSACRFQRQVVRRKLATATATATATLIKPHIHLASHSSPGASHDDRTLRQIFDSAPFWRDFSRRSHTRESRGLFQNRYLTRPDGFQTFAAVTLEKARGIVAKVLEASSVEEYKTVVRDMDRLSDLLCRVIDLSDFVRQTHPDRRMQAAASEAYGLMYEYMNVLNTTTGLNHQLKVAVADPEVSADWTEEERVVAHILIKDFAKSAIDLPERTRQKFVELSNDISRLGPDFVDGMTPEKPYLVIGSSRLKGLDPLLAKQLTRFGKATLPTVGAQANLALRNVEDAGLRKELYMANRTASREQIYRLDELLRKRAELARLSGYESYGHMTLQDKMAMSPVAVDGFLQALGAGNGERVRGELAELLKLKQASTQDTGPIDLEPWDREYYMSRLRAQTRSKARQPDFLSAYFSLGTVMQGISRLMNRLYGVRLVPYEAAPGETWNGDVRRLDVRGEDGEQVAVVYCDLFEREGKSPNPAHCTLRCSRVISEEEVAGSWSSAEKLFDSPEETVTDGMASARDDQGRLHQLPTIALICDFSRGSSPTAPTLLSFREVQTLFHEMGHALHSVLGRTVLQNVSGTRCATDFAELPSVLMERFAGDAAVLGLYARHWKTDAPLPTAMVAERLAQDGLFDGVDTATQLLFSALDQHYHSTAPLSSSFDSTASFHAICAAHATLPEPPGTRWHGFFGHLFGYGATYYSYLFDRAIAGKVWTDVFGGGGTGGGALSSAAGARFREEVLRWGGGRDGWSCVAGVLDRPDLAEGGPRAMAEVGRWGVKG